jgi:hypothetical protein
VLAADGDGAFLVTAAGVGEVLDDGGVDDEFVSRRRVLGFGGFGDEGLQDGADDGVVPALGLRVLVVCGAADGGGAGVGADLAQARCGNGL